MSVGDWLVAVACVLLMAGAIYGIWKLERGLRSPFCTRCGSVIELCAFRKRPWWRVGEAVWECRSCWRIV